MMQVNAKCTNCGENILIDNNKEANVCSNCKEAFITEKAIKVHSGNTANNEQTKNVGKRQVFKSLGKGLLMVLDCLWYLFYVLFFVWLFIDITDDLKKK